MGCKIEGAASWGLQISALILSISLSNFLLSSGCWLTCCFNIFIMEKISLLDIKIRGSWNPPNTRLPWLVLGEVLFLDISKVLFWLGGSLRGAGRLLDEVGGIEEEDTTGYIDMIFWELWTPWPHGGWQIVLVKEWFKKYQPYYMRECSIAINGNVKMKWKLHKWFTRKAFDPC